MFACPYCKERTEVPGAANFWMVDAANATCEHCRRDFVIVDSVPITEEQYRTASPHGRPLRAQRWGRASDLPGSSPDPQV